MRKLFIAGLLCAGLVACGDDDGGGSSSGSSSSGDELTKAEFIAKGDALCGDLQDEVDRLDKETDSLTNPSVKDVAPFFRQVADKAKETLEDFRELKPPAEDEQTIEDYLDGQEKVVNAIEAVAQASDDNDEDEVKRLIEENEDIDDESTRLAKRYGFTKCDD